MLGITTDNPGVFQGNLYRTTPVNPYPCTQLQFIHQLGYRLSINPRVLITHSQIEFTVRHTTIYTTCTNVNKSYIYKTYVKRGPKRRPISYRWGPVYAHWLL